MTSGGLPHSGTRGSTPADGSPRLVAAFRALHRPSTPRHPPCAHSSSAAMHHTRTTPSRQDRLTSPPLCTCQRTETLADLARTAPRPPEGTPCASRQPRTLARPPDQLARPRPTASKNGPPGRPHTPTYPAARPRPYSSFVCGAEYSNRYLSLKSA